MTSQSPLINLHHHCTMSTFYETDDELLSEAQKRRRIQALNDELRAKLRSRDANLGEDELFITRGLAGTARSS